MKLFQRIKWTIIGIPASFTCKKCNTQGVGMIWKWQKIQCPNCGTILENEMTLGDKS